MKDVRSAKMIETRHGLESNPVPSYIHFEFYCPFGSIGTGLDSRPCLVSIIFADLTSLHPPSFILVPPIVSSLKRNYSPPGAPLREP